MNMLCLSYFLTYETYLSVLVLTFFTVAACIEMGFHMDFQVGLTGMPDDIPTIHKSYTSIMSKTSIDDVN